jgi:phytol kinase
MQPPFSLSPAVWNCILTVLTFVYVFSLVAILDFLVTKKGLPPDISRKITHIGAGSLVLFWGLYADGHWTQYLNVSVYVVWIVLLSLKGLTADENDDAVKTMTRTGDRRELLRGPLYFVIVGTICGTLYYKAFPGIVAMAMLTWGDGMAPIIGSRFGKMKYRILSNKSVEGSLAMLVMSFLAALAFVQLLNPATFNVQKIAILAVAATLAEAVSPPDLDNFAIPIVVIGVNMLLG